MRVAASAGAEQHDPLDTVAIEPAELRANSIQYRVCRKELCHLAIISPVEAVFLQPLPVEFETEARASRDLHDTALDRRAVHDEMGPERVALRVGEALDIG